MVTNPEWYDKKMTIKGFNYHKTNYFVIVGDSENYLAFDSGWPGTYFDYARSMKEAGISIKQVKWIIVSHFHMDHAGLVGEIQSHGITAVVFENQLDHVDEMEQMITRSGKSYVPIKKEALLNLSLDSSRNWLHNFGFSGELISTPGHSPDSISFISDKGEALIGDLYLPDSIMENDINSKISWQRLKEKNVTQVFPSHQTPLIITPYFNEIN